MTIDRMLDGDEVPDQPEKLGIHHCTNCGKGTRFVKYVQDGKYIESCSGCEWKLTVPVGLTKDGEQQLVLGTATEVGVRDGNDRKLDELKRQ